MRCFRVRLLLFVAVVSLAYTTVGAGKEAPPKIEPQAERSLRQLLVMTYKRIRQMPQYTGLYSQWNFAYLFGCPIEQAEFTESSVCRNRPACEENG